MLDLDANPTSVLEHKQVELGAGVGSPEVSFVGCAMRSTCSSTNPSHDAPDFGCVSRPPSSRMPIRTCGRPESRQQERIVQSYVFERDARNPAFQAFDVNDEVGQFRHRAAPEPADRKSLRIGSARAVRLSIAPDDGGGFG